MTRRPLLLSALIVGALLVPAEIVASRHGAGIAHMLAGTQIAKIASTTMRSLGLAAPAPSGLGGAMGGGVIAASTEDLRYLTLNASATAPVARVLASADMPASQAAGMGGAGGVSSTPELRGGDILTRSSPVGIAAPGFSVMPGPVRVVLPKAKTPSLSAPTSGHADDTPAATTVLLTSGTVVVPASSPVADAPATPALAALTAPADVPAAPALAALTAPPDEGVLVSGAPAVSIDTGGTGAPGETPVQTDAPITLAALVPALARELVAATDPQPVSLDVIKQLQADDGASGPAPAIAVLAPVLLAVDAVVPEPGTLMLILAGLLGLGAISRRSPRGNDRALSHHCH